MKKKYLKPHVQSDDTLEQTANATGVNLDSTCTIPGLIDPKTGCDGVTAELNCNGSTFDVDGCELFPGETAICFLKESK